MIKVYINNEEVLCDKNIVIKKEMLNTSSTILNNVYPKSWETTHDYTTNYYYPLDYSNCKITDIRETPAEEGQTIEGTNFNINVDLSKEYSFDSFKGNTTQEGTPTPSNPVNVNVVTGGQEISVVGKNLFSGEPYQANAVIQANGNINSNNNNDLFKTIVEPNQTYTISITSTETTTNRDIRIISYTMGGTYIEATVSYKQIKPNITTTQTFTTPANAGYILYYVLHNSKDVMLEKGSTATTYEPYQSQSYEINLGKNLFDKDNANVISAYISAGKKISKNSNDKIIYIPCKPNTTYSLQKMVQGTTSKNRFRIGTTTDIPILDMYVEDFFNAGDGSTLTTKTITTGANANYLLFYCYCVDNVTTFNEMLNSIQIEQNDQPTEYAPYKTPMELCKIGNYQDRIYKNNDKWYIEKQIGKVVLNGSESWTSRAFSDNSYLSVKMTLQPKENGGLCNYFISDNRYDIVEEHMTISKQWNELCFAILKSRLDTPNATGFKTWLSNNNVLVYYVLNTPTTTEITDTELINQLESIELIEGTNNISSNGNLPIIMNLHYNYVTHRIDTILLFSGIVKNTGNISLNPREPHYTSIEVLGYETFLSEGETLDFVIYEKTIEEAIDLVINTISDYGIIKGNINIKNPNDIIGAYSTKDKTAYDVFNYIADITQSRWTTRIIDENTIAIDFYDPDLMTNGTGLDFTQKFFASNNIIDMQYNYGTRDYRNKQVMNSSAVYSNIETNETIIADGYQTQFNTTDKIGEITRMTLNGSEVIVKTKDEYELGYTCDFYYTPGNNYFESVDLVSTGAVLVIDYYAIIQGREILLNNTEINRVSSMTGRKGVISRYEDRNDATTTTELSQIGQSYLRYKGSPEIILTIESLNDIWNIGEKVEFNNAPLNELATEYMVKKKTIHYIPTIDNIFYDFELTSNFNSENAINYFDNQRSKNKGNIGQGETISRNIDISNTANVIFYDVDIQEVTIDGDNTLNSTLNSPLVQ